MKTQKNSVRRSLILSATALMISVAMLIGTTFAWFTDSVSSGKNKIVAGNLDVELEYATQANVQNGTIAEDAWKSVQDSTELFDENALWEPGHTEVVYLRIKNAGTLAFNYTLNVSPVSETEGINQSSERFKLSDYLVFGTTDATDTVTVYNDRTDARNAAGTVQKLNQTNLQKKGLLLADGYKYTALVVYMPTDVGNVANYGKVAPSIDLGLTLYATQAQYEEDSFGDDYDANANLDPDNTGKDVMDYQSITPLNETAVIVRDTEGNITSATSASGKVKYNKNTKRIEIRSTNSNKEIKIEIPVEAVDEQANSITVNVVPTDTPDTISFDSNTQAARSFDMKIEGLKSPNTSLIRVNIPFGAKLQDLAMYRDNVKMQKETKPANFVADEYVYNSNSLLNYVQMAVTTSTATFTAVYNAPIAYINDTAYATLANAVSSAKDGETIVLLRDIDDNSTISPKDKAITIDLNQHTFKTSTSSAVFKISNNASLTIKNGVIESKGEATGDASTGCVAVYINAGTDTSSPLCMENVTFTDENKQAVIGSFGNNVTINIKNCNITAKSGYAIYHNGTNSPANVTIDNSTIMTTAAKTPAIFISNTFNATPQTLNITNSTISGANAIEVKHTNATITGSKLIATDTNPGYEENGNGTSTWGYCFATCKNTGEAATSGTIALTNNTYESAVPGCYVFNESAENGATITNDAELTILNPSKLTPDAPQE